MSRTPAQAFVIFLDRLIPTASERAAATMHRTSVENCLTSRLDVRRFLQTGSFRHGTGITSHVDVDLLVSLKTVRPQSSDAALAWVKSALQASFPATYVHTSRPAAVIEFAGGKERWEVVPGFLTGRGGTNVFVYDIPGAATGWIDTAPEEHLAYVNEINDRRGIVGGAKGLARLAKAWKYYKDVPISSFYLEMRATEYMATQASIGWTIDVWRYFEHLEKLGLAAMEDPRRASGQIYPCSSTAAANESLSQVRTAARRARSAVVNEHTNPAAAFASWDLVFGGRFPSRL